MKAANNNSTLNESSQKIDKSAEMRKPYISPELTLYGDISSLVQAVVVGAADGGAPPFQAMS